MINSIVIELISVSLIASVISSQAIQKIKEIFNLGSIFNKIMSLFISFGIGFCYSYSFYSNSWLYALWIGLFTMIGAERLYKSFNGRFGLESLPKEK